VTTSNPRAIARIRTHDGRTEKGASHLAFWLLNKPMMSKSVIGPPSVVNAFAIARSVYLVVRD
jgi:hypothetical protein